MKIAAYVQPHRMTSPTGVGKHAINMLDCFRRMPGVQVCAVASCELLDPDGSMPAATGLGDLPVSVINIPRKRLEWSWALLGRPLVDPWAGQADWIYSPAELFVPSRQSRTAATCHSVVDFERAYPGYGAAWRRKERLRWRLMMRPIVERTDLIFSVSEHLKGRVVELFGARPERVVVVGNGVEDEYFKATQLPRPAGMVPYIITVGGLRFQKNDRCVLGVARLLKEKKSPLEVWVVGGGEAAREREALALGNVRLLGYRGISELPQLVRNAVASLFVSRYESFGIPAVEAMAAGTPVVVSQWYGLPEVVGGGGLIVDGDSPEEAASVCMRLFGDGAFREASVRRGLERAKTFTWQSCAERALRAMGGLAPLV